MTDSDLKRQFLNIQVQPEVTEHSFPKLNQGLKVLPCRMQSGVPGAMRKTKADKIPECSETCNSVVLLENKPHLGRKSRTPIQQTLAFLEVRNPK